MGVTSDSGYDAAQEFGGYTVGSWVCSAVGGGDEEDGSVLDAPNDGDEGDHQAGYVLGCGASNAVATSL